MNCFKILYQPEKAFGNIGAKPSWGVDCVIISVVLIVISYFLFPVQDRIMELSLHTLTPEQREAMKSMSAVTTITRYVTLALVPLSLLFSSLVTAALVYAGTSICKGKKVFKELFALSIAAYMIKAIGGYVNTVVLVLIKGVESMQHPLDVSPTGLNALFDIKNTGVFLYSFLSSITFFEIWFVVVMIFGISRLAGINAKKSAVIVITIWLLTTLVIASIASLTPIP
ncbi:MAG: YIP1 family protein [Bacteroidales bacterium]|jgi:hypothetical protein|nr:YIP1 family protein [Bacteroidales bacterium]